MVQNALEIKEKIISLLKSNGPSLPVHIARGTGLSILFASAFLSELLSEKRIKMSDMRVGSSPLYFLPGQEHLLERFSQHLKSKEKEAFSLLKEKKFLKDREQEPAIRVALRGIKDFAVPFQDNNEIVWKYFTIEESEFDNSIKKELRKEEQTDAKAKTEGLGIFDKSQEEKPLKKEKRISTKPAKKQGLKSKNNRGKFFNKVKEFLAKKQIEILDIEEISAAKIIFRVKDEEEYLIIAYNKKRVSEQDILNAHKKSKELSLPYQVLSLGEPLKKFDNFLNAVKTLKSIEKIE